MDTIAMEEDGMELSERRRKIMRVGAIGVAANAALATVKAAVGFAANSAAIVGDAVNNLSDVLSFVSTMIGVRLAGQPADREHPYGHGRAEYVSGVLVAVIVLYSGVQVFMEGLREALHPGSTRYGTPAIVVMAVSVVAKVLLGLFTRSQGRKNCSEALVGSGMDALCDAAASAAILLSVALAIVWNVHVDGWLAMGIAALTVKSGIDIAKASADSILGHRIDPDYAFEVKQAVCSFPSVQEAYDLMLHRYGADMTVGSVQIAVPDDMMAKDIDRLSRQIQHAMFRRFGLIMTVGVYAAGTSPESDRIRRTLSKMVLRDPDILQVHGFYLDAEEASVSFHVIVDYASPRRRKIKESLARQLSSAYPQYSFHVTLDHDFSD